MDRKDEIKNAELKNTESIKHFVKHEWEEIAHKLCNSDDPKLREMGNRYKQELLATQKGN